MIKDDALALMRNYIFANRVTKPIQNDGKKISTMWLPESLSWVSRKLRRACHGEGPVTSALLVLGGRAG